MMFSPDWEPNRPAKLSPREIEELQEQIRVVSNSWWKLYHAGYSAHAFGMFPENVTKVLTEALFHADAVKHRVQQVD